MQQHHVFALTSQSDIDAVANGQVPGDYSTWSFDSKAEVDAYVEASNVLREEGLEVHSFHMDGTTTVFNVSIDGGVVFPRSKSFKTAFEARAFQIGLREFSGLEDWKAISSDDTEAFAHLQAIEDARENRLAAIAAESRPTIVIYKSADQISRVIASQGVRVIVLDADGVGLEEDAPRTLQIDDQELFVSDLIVTGKVGASPYGEQGVDDEFVREVVKAVEGLPAGCNASFNKPGQFADPFPYSRSIQVKNPDLYASDNAPVSHQVSINDKRLSSGQFSLTVESLEEWPNLMPLTVEVNRNPQNDEQVPCLHVQFNASAPAFTAFKLHDKIMIRPEKGVFLTETMSPDGAIYIVE